VEVTPHRREARLTERPPDRYRQIPMRLLKTALAVAVVVLAVAGCSDGDGDWAEDPAGVPGSHGEMPTAPVAADGEVTTRNPAIVMDTGSPELCLGPVAESYPPQCGGPPLEGWNWADHEGAYDRVGEVRWGTFYVTGTWDGATFTVTSAETPPAGQLPPASEMSPPPEQELSADELGAIADQVRTLGGATGAYAHDERVWVDVPYDDGSLQDWVDEEYGDRVVVVTPALVDA
jgi:hypothetical protein